MLIGKGTLDERLSVEAVRYNIGKVTLLCENVTIEPIGGKPGEFRIDFNLDEASDLMHAFENAISQQKERAEDAERRAAATEKEAGTPTEAPRDPGSFSLHRLDPEHPTQPRGGNPGSTPGSPSTTGKGA